MELNQQFEAANRRARELQDSHPTAVSAHFDRRAQRIVIQLSSRMELAFSPRDAEGLENARPAELEPIIISPSGFGIHFPRLEADLYLPALLAGVLGSKRWMADRQRLAETVLPMTSKSEPIRTSAVRPKRPTKTPGRRSLQLVPPRSLAAGPPERTHPEVKKHHHDHGGDQEHAMIRPVGPAGSHAPKVWSEDDDGQKEEDACNLKPQNAAHTPKGTQKASDAASNAPAGLGGGSPRRLYAIDGARNHLGSRLDTRLALLRGAGGRAGKPFTGHAPRNAESGAKDAANGLWSHTVYDGSSDAG